MAKKDIKDIIEGTPPSLHTSKTGTGDNYSEIREDGTQRLKGTATSWKDMVADLMGRSLLTTRDKIEYDWDEMAIEFSKGGSISNSKDRVGGNLEINHEFKVSSAQTFKPHIHWFQTVDTGVAQACTLTLEYRLQENNKAKNATWVEVDCDTGLGGDDIFDFTGEADGTYNQISRFPDMTFDCHVSDTIQFRIARTDTTNDEKMLVYFFDIHGEVDSFGSDEEIAKS